jgi:hypothetical protein
MNTNLNYDNIIKTINNSIISEKYKKQKKSNLIKINFIINKIYKKTSLIIFVGKMIKI